MKNFNTQFRPVAGLFVLGAAVPVSVYLIGFIFPILLALPAMLLLLLFGSNILGVYVNGAAIVCLVLQCVGIVVLTVFFTVFFNLRVYHVLPSLAVTAAAFFLVQRYFRFISAANFPESGVFFPKLYKYVGLAHVNDEMYLEMRLYLITTLLLTAGSAVVVLLAWSVVRIKIRR